MSRSPARRGRDAPFFFFLPRSLATKPFKDQKCKDQGNVKELPPQDRPKAHGGGGRPGRPGRPPSGPPAQRAAAPAPGRAPRGERAGGARAPA